MKRTLLFLACVLTSLTMSAQGDLTVGDIQNSGCLSRTRGKNEPLPTIILTKEGSFLSVQLLNYESNCATSDFNVTPTVSGGSDGVPYSVNINVVPYLPGDEAMDCICPYNVSFTVRDVEANSFYLSCWWYEGEVTLEEGKPLVLEDIWEEVTIDGMKYTLRKAMGRAMLVDGSTQKGEVRIPSELSYEGKDYTVTSIGESAFTENMNLTKVFIPRTIMNTDLSYNVGFYSDPFYGCTALQSIEVEDGNPAVCSVDGVLFNKEKTKLLSYPAGATQTSYTVPESVTWIEPLAFSYSQHLRVVTLTDYVTELGYSAFYECKSLEEVRLPSGLKTLANYLFGNCQRLKSVTIPQGVTYLGLKAFYCCTSLTSVTMPESITSTDYSVFEGCTSLESVTLSPNLSKIEYNMFANCSSMKKLLIPNSVTMVGSEAFKNCSALTSLDLPKSINRLGYSVFAGCKLNSLYIRGVIDSHWMSSSIFTDMDTQTELYVLSSEMEKFQAIYKGPVYPLPEVQEDSDYLPFVEEGKEWHVVRSEANQGYHFDKYMLPQNATLIDDETGKTYYIMYKSEDDKEESNIVGIFREEDRKVYYIESNPQTYIMPKENLLFDYSLKAGDTYETYSYDEEKMVTYKVLSVDDYTEGPQVRLKKYDEKTGNMITHSRYLRKWTVCRTDDNSIQKTWIEGVGSLEGPLENLYNDSPISTCSNLAYVSVNVESEGFIVQFLPFSFYDMYNQVHGSGLSAAADQSSTDWDEQFTFELEGNLLHVHGKTYLNCGCAHYAYFFEEQTEDPFVRKLHFQIQREGVEATCYSFAILDFYVPGFYPEINYTVVDEYGEEYPVFNKMAYRPMIEDGKVWKVGNTMTVLDNSVQVVKYYYFDGDTIINGKNCKQMMCQLYVNPDYPDYDYWSHFPSLSKVGAWNEEDKKVYLYNDKTPSMKIMYDFSLDENDIIYFLVEGGYQPYLGPKQTGGIEGFKGVYRDVLMGNNVCNTTWLEGVGGIEGPTFNAYQGKEYHTEFLMSCTFGDEVIYLNDEYEDGATPTDAEAKKHRFDFTHTIKTKPRTRSEAEEQSLYGEYNNLLLGINLEPLDEAYLVRITNESDQVVYEKTINAGSIVGLNIDISAFAKGRYTVTMENSSEVFTGEFETITTGIQEFINKEETKNFNSSTLQFFNSIYNLQGQRLNTLQKGLNIVNGRKVLVK